LSDADKFQPVMPEVFGQKLLLTLLGQMPAIVVRRFVKLQKIQEKHFRLELANPTPITIRPNNDAPEIVISLRATNRNAISVTVDRILLEITFGQLVLESAYLRRFTVKPRETTAYIDCRFFLNELQRNAVRARLNDNQRVNERLRISMLAVCESDVGYFEFNKHFDLERRAVQVQ
jgi:hypothetical protein